MVENRPWLTVFSHAVLIAGILVVAFPLYVTFVASTRSLEDILSVPMPLVPGTELWENYHRAWTAGVRSPMCFVGCPATTTQVPAVSSCGSGSMPETDSPTDVFCVSFGAA